MAVLIATGEIIIAAETRKELRRVIEVAVAMVAALAIRDEVVIAVIKLNVTVCVALKQWPW